MLLLLLLLLNIDVTNEHIVLYCIVGIVYLHVCGGAVASSLVATTISSIASLLSLFAEILVAVFGHSESVCSSGCLGLAEFETA